MKKILTYFFVTLGVIFFVLICVLMYIWFADPFNIRPMITMLTADSPSSSVGVNESIPATPNAVPPKPTVDKNPALTNAQEEALESIGINPANLPSTITPEMEACFTTKLGVARVSEIKAGDSPTPIEVFTTRECYE